MIIKANKNMYNKKINKEEEKKNTKTRKTGNDLKSKRVAKRPV